MHKQYFTSEQLDEGFLVTFRSLKDGLLYQKAMMDMEGVVNFFLYYMETHPAQDQVVESDGQV